MVNASNTPFMRGARWFSRVGRILVSLTLAVLVLFCGECLVRRWAPQDQRLVMVRGTSLAVPDPVLGHRNRPGAVAIQSGPEFHARYEINEQGLRDANLYRTAPFGTTRVLLIGDSFTFGFANAYQDSWPVHLERALQERGLDVECVKAGVPGYDTRVEALYLASALESFRPDVVVLVLLPNDVITNRPLATSIDSLGEPPVVRPEDKPMALHLPMLLARKLMEHDGPYAMLYGLTSRDRVFRADDPSLEKLWPITEDLLSHVANLCSAQGVSLIVASLPQSYQVRQAARAARRSHLDLTAIDRRLGGWSAASGVPVVHLLDGMAAENVPGGAPLYYALDGHLTPRGNLVASRILASALTDFLMTRR